METSLWSLSLITQRLSDAKTGVEMSDAKTEAKDENSQCFGVSTVAMLNFGVFLIDPHFRDVENVAGLRF